MYEIKAAEMTPNQPFEGFESVDHFLRVGGCLAETASESGELGWVFFVLCCKTALIV